MKEIKKVAITGGTHGNELTGVYLIKKFKNNPTLIERDSFETIFFHTNKKAIKKCVRYIDKDLNRTFNIKDLKDDDKYLYEDILAKNINAKLGPKGSKDCAVDFIVDLHSTTSNMGMSIVIDNDSPLTWMAAAYAKSKNPKVNIFRWKGDTDDASFVNSISKDGFAIEVGAVPQGVLRADIFFQTEKLIYDILDFLDAYNRNLIKDLPKSVEIYDHIELLDYPRDENGELIAMVHPSLQDNDYSLIKKGDPLFITLEGKDICYDKDEEVHALFINEAAYYEKGFAMCLTKKRVIEIS